MQKSDVDPSLPITVALHIPSTYIPGFYEYFEPKRGAMAVATGGAVPTSAQVTIERARILAWRERQAQLGHD